MDGNNGDRINNHFISIIYMYKHLNENISPHIHKPWVGSLEIVWFIKIGMAESTHCTQLVVMPTFYIQCMSFSHHRT